MDDTMKKEIIAIISDVTGFDEEEIMEALNL